MKSRILICVGSSGISAGAEKVADLFEKGVKDNKLEKKFEVIRTGDRGLFRDVLIDVISPEGERIVYEFVKPEDVPKILDEHIVGGKPVENLLAKEDYFKFFEGQERIVLINCGEIDPEDIDDYISHEGYEGLKKAFKMTPIEVIEEIKTSYLRGRGGAGFPTGLKWEFANKAKGDEKYIICNADEGDPGAFMDRSVLEGDPHAVIEGMIIGGYAMGANHGYIYCRAEYPLAIKRLEIAIKQATKKGFLGSKVLGTDFSFHIKIKEGAGAFVCGEETALIASIEGKRGMPRPRPPFPANSGLWGKPTNINNVETLANIRHIILKGGEWYSSIGTEKSKGTKVFALAGKIKNTGLVEVPMGTSIKDIIYGPGSGMVRPNIKFKAVQLGGPSGGCIPDSLIDTPVDYDSINETGAIMGSGGMIIMDQKTCMVDIAKYFLNFTVAESCGKCVPCRVGLKRMLEVLEKITMGEGKSHHINFLSELGETIKSAALCGLGNTAPNPVLTTMKYFMDEYQTHIMEKECPSHVCQTLLHFEVMDKECKKCGICKKECPVDAITWEKGTYAKIDKQTCIECKSCINACPFMAIK